MKHHTETEENYVKCILKFSQLEGEPVSTNTIANYLGTSAASVTDMLKKLDKKDLLDYTKYKGVRLTKEGKKVALKIIRKHRLWEVFLVEKLNFSWDNVHDMAEQLEHIDSVELIRRLDEFLGYPKFDPHGDPIPSEDGEIESRNTHILSDMEPQEVVVIASVRRSDPEFLQYLDKIGLTINRRIQIIEKLSFDDSLQIQVEGKNLVVGGIVADNLHVIRAE